MITKNIVESLNRSVLEELELARKIKHPGENGRAREQILRDFLKKMIPKKFNVDTGFVIDATGETSNQIDLVIYREDYHPVFEIGGIKHFMIEAVVAVIENKASIASTAILKQSLQNISSVKALDRTNRGSNRTLPKLQPLDKSNLYHQVFGAILTEKSLSTKSLEAVFQKYFESTPNKGLWPNMYCDVRGSSFRYISQDQRVIVDPRAAAAYAISDPKIENYNPPLIELAYELISILRVLPLVDFAPDAYFHGVSGRAKKYVSFPMSLRG